MSYIDSNGNFVGTGSLVPNPNGAASSPTPALPTSTTPPTPTAPPGSVPTTTNANTGTTQPPPDANGLDSNSFLGVLNGINSGLQTNNTFVDQKNAVLDAYLGNPLDPAAVAKLPPDIQSIIQSGNKSQMLLQAQVLNDTINSKNSSVASSIQFLTQGWEQAQTRVQTELNNLMTFATNNGYQIGDLVKAMAPVFGKDLSAQLSQNLQALGVSPYVKSSLTPNIMTPGTGGSTVPSTSLDAAITAQEGGTYTTVNPDSGALGKYQIMPGQLANLTNPTTGQPLDPNNPQDVQMFLNTPAMQDQLFKQVTTNLQNKYPNNIDQQIAAYYGGAKGAAVVGTAAGDTPQGKYPSINQYVQDVKAKMTQSANQSLSPIYDQTVKSYATDIANGTLTSLTGVPAGYRNSVAIYMAQNNVQSPLGMRRGLLAAQAAVANYIALPEYQIVANSMPYLLRIDAEIKQPGSVSDQALLDAYTKLSNNGAVISDAQVSLVTGGASLADSANILQKKFSAQGGVLSDDQRQQVYSLGNLEYTALKDGYQPIYDQALQDMQAAGIQPQYQDAVLPDLNTLSALSEAAVNAGSGGTSGAPPPSGGSSGASSSDPLGLNI